MSCAWRYWTRSWTPTRRCRARPAGRRAARATEARGSDGDRERRTVEVGRLDLRPAGLGGPVPRAGPPRLAGRRAALCALRRAGAGELLRRLLHGPPPGHLGVLAGRRALVADR